MEITNLIFYTSISVLLTSIIYGLFMEVYLYIDKFEFTKNEIKTF